MPFNWSRLAEQCVEYHARELAINKASRFAAGRKVPIEERLRTVEKLTKELKSEAEADIRAMTGMELLELIGDTVAENRKGKTA